MRICVVSTPIFRLPVAGYSGLEHLAWQQAKGLAELGHDVSLVAPDGSTCPGVTVIPCGPERGVNEKNAYKRYWPELLKMDAVLDSSWSKWSYMLKAEGRLKAPILGILHAPVATMYQTLPPVEKPCMVCISHDHAASFLGVHNRAAKVCYNGIDLSFYKPINVPRTDRFLFVARFSSVKSPDVAIQACLDAGVGLDLVGDTSITNEPALLEQCKKMADGKQIRLVGPASRGETVYWYSQAHAFLHVVPHFREPFGLAPVEAQACGLPVVGWRNGALPETVQDGETGLLCGSFPQLVAAVKRVASELPSPRDKIRQWAGQFSVERMVKRYEELCVEALEGGGW